MCGAFALFDYVRNDMVDLFDGVDYEPTYNIRPTMQSPVVLERDGMKIAKLMRFGLVPVWAKDEKTSYKMFNARSETLFEKPAWKRSAKSKRCLIPANGFYEWRDEGDGKHAYYIHQKDDELISFAGVYDNWTNRDTGEVVGSYAIITSQPNKEMKPIHDRMPVILNKGEEDQWLQENDQGLLMSLLDPYTNGGLDIFEVSTEVNSAKNQGKELIKPITQS